jgi:hypothetical protein
LQPLSQRFYGLHLSLLGQPSFPYSLRAYEALQLLAPDITDHLGVPHLGNPIQVTGEEAVEKRVPHFASINSG